MLASENGENFEGFISSAGGSKKSAPQSVAVANRWFPPNASPRATKADTMLLSMALPFPTLSPSKAKDLCCSG